MLALAFGRDEQAAEAVAALAENAATDVFADGVHCECSSDYHMIVLRSFVGSDRQRAAWPGSPSRRCWSERTRASATSRCTCSDPTARRRRCPTAIPGDFRTLLRRAGELLDRPDLLWAASGGAEGSPPATRAASFPVGGYFVQRSGWGDDGRAYADERWSVLDCGPLGDGGHGHYDQLSVELMADGHLSPSTPGRYTYAEDDTRLARVVQGDRRAQHRDRRRPRPDAVPPGQAEGPDLDRATAVAAHRAGPRRPVRPASVSPQYDAVHTRTLALVDDDYWVVHDRLRASSAHDYTARWHLDRHAEARVAVRRGARTDRR